VLASSEEIAVEAQAKKIKYIFIFRDQNAGENRKIEKGKLSPKSVADFKYFDKNPNESKLHSWSY
jgi:hypothetical protein